MKKITLSMAVIATMSMFTSLQAQSLSQALKEGKVSGEVSLTHEQRNFDKDNGAYYRDSGYAVGSFALKYESGIWNNLQLTSKFRAYKTIFEDDKNATTSYGTGDASERFREKDGTNQTADIEELYVTYTPFDNFTVTSGRQFISSHWFNKTQDGVKVDTSFGNTSLEAIWSLRHGRIYSRDYRPMTKFNENKGAYQVALTHKFDEKISITAYDYISPDVRDIIGGKVNTDIAGFSLGAHYAVSNEDVKTVKDSDFLHLSASTTLAGFTPYIGYVKVDDDAAFPGYSAENSGETSVPFEEGDYFYSKGAQTLYVGVSKAFGALSTTVLYGETEYLNDSNKKLDMNETTLWLGYPVTNNVQANLGYTMVNETDDATHGDYNQLNLTLTYSF